MPLNGRIGGSSRRGQRVDLSDEAMKQLELARQARREEQKAQRMERKSPVQPPIRTEMKEIGVILPVELRPGERVSGSVVEDPPKYDGGQDLRLVRMKLPLESPGMAATLGGWQLEAAGEGPQRADGPVTFTVPHASEFSVTLRQVGNPTRAVSRPVLRRGPSRGIHHTRSRQLHLRLKPTRFASRVTCVPSVDLSAGTAPRPYSLSAAGRHALSQKQKIPLTLAFQPDCRRV
jgi:hypothetical protein